jgi:hypothetical protein
MEGLDVVVEALQLEHQSPPQGLLGHQLARSLVEDWADRIFRNAVITGNATDTLAGKLVPRNLRKGRNCGLKLALLAWRNLL